MWWAEKGEGSGGSREKDGRVVGEVRRNWGRVVDGSARIG